MVRHCLPLFRLLTFIFSFPSPSFTSLPYAVVILFIDLLDEETAEYLSSVLSNGSQLDVRKIKAALEESRQRTTPPLNLEARITDALASLGIR